MFHRLITPYKSSSYFLFGPRGTGKTTLLRAEFTPESCEYIDLLRPEEEQIFNRNPEELEQRAQGLIGKKKWIILDEIQRVPRLLDVVHRLIESTPIHFAMTGSSSRKLRRGASNLLAGRAFVNRLHPLTLKEIEGHVPLLELLRWGGLPRVLQLETPGEKAEYLRAYTHTYLREEIAAEQIVRKLDPFRNFLGVAAQCNGQILNTAKIGRDTGADPKTIQTYFSILEDTMIGFLLPSWHQSLRKRQSSKPKFFFFDPGVKRALDFTISQEMYEGSFAFGNAFEHLIILEWVRLNDYFKVDFRFSYLRTPSGLEIDLVLDRPGKPVAFVEIKSSDHVSEEDCKVVAQFQKETKNSEAFCVSREPNRKKIGNVLCIPYTDAAQELDLTPTP